MGRQKEVIETNHHCLRMLEAVVKDLSTHCDHVEHNESNDVNDINVAAQQLRDIAVELALQNDVSLLALYANRIRAMEENSIMRHAPLYGGASSFLGAETIASSSTWHDLQIGQLQHDKQFHPDVFGMSKHQQLRHYVLHIAKLPDYLSKATMENKMAEFCQERLADIIAFGVKLATLRGEELAETPIEKH